MASSCCSVDIHSVIITNDCQRSTAFDGLADANQLMLQVSVHGGTENLFVLHDLQFIFEAHTRF